MHLNPPRTRQLTPFRPHWGYIPIDKGEYEDLLSTSKEEGLVTSAISQLHRGHVRLSLTEQLASCWDWNYIVIKMRAASYTTSMSADAKVAMTHRARVFDAKT